MNMSKRWEQRKIEVINMAAGPDMPPQDIEYTAEELGTWQTVSDALDHAWSGRVDPALIAAKQSLGLSNNEVPQLTQITEALKNRSGFKFRAVGGLALASDFFGGLADGRFLSTQFLRDGSDPFYTPEPDMIHEVIGHGTLLAHPEMAELHRLAGRAYQRMETARAKKFMADVWWFSGEFGVVRSGDTIQAVGAGLLSSVGELEQFQASAQQLEIHPLIMGFCEYKIDEFQKKLFVADSIAHMCDVVGSIFAEAQEDKILREASLDYRWKKFHFDLSRGHMGLMIPPTPSAMWSDLL